MPFKNLTFAALGFSLAFFPNLSFAADDDEDTDNDTEVVTVVSERLPVTEEEVGSSVTVLDEEAIKQSQKVTVFDLLSTTPGVSVSRNGGIGTVATLRIRGAQSGQTLVLIDGVKVNDLSSPSGEFNFANLTADSIERIEVLRGPQSTLYGSDAIGGVINIVTKKGDGPFRVSGFAEGGSFATFRGGFDAGIKSEKTSFNLSLSGTRTDGISAADAGAGNTERDGFRTVQVIANADHKLTDHLSVNAFVRHADSKAGFDAFDFINGGFTDGDGVTDTTDRQIAFGAVLDWLGGKATTDVKVSFSRVMRFDHENQAPSFSSLSKNRTVDILNTVRVSDHLTALIGGQFQNNDIETETFGAFASMLRGSADINSVFGEVSAEPNEDVTLTFGARRDDHEIFGGHTTFRVTGNWRVTPTTTLRANWGEGFKAPTLFQLFSSFGDPALKPETSAGWEVGIEQEVIPGKARLSVTWFQSKSKNLIDFNLITFTYANILATRAKGVEVVFEADVTEKLKIAGNYTFLDAVDATTGLQQIRRPKNTFNATVTFDATDRLSLGAGVNNTSRQIDAGVFLDPFTVVDLRASYEVSEKITLYGRIENAFDADYQEVLGFGTPGIAGYGGLRGTF